jgi:hypothetical protein
MPDIIHSFGVEVDPNPVKRGVRESNRALGSLKSSFRQLRNAVLAFTVATVGLALLGKRLLKLGASALETRSKFLVTFGDSAAAVDRFLREFNLISGLSKTTSENLLADTAAIGQGLGMAADASADFAIEVAKLSGDLASFKDLRTEDVVLRLQTALTGEFEVLKRLGIIVKAVNVDERALLNTRKESADQLTELDRVTARFQLITEGAGVAVGDLARTSQSTANVMKQLSAAWKDFQDRLGLFLAQSPIVNAFLISVRDMLRNMTKILSGNAEQIKRAFELLGIIAGNAFSYSFNKALLALMPEKTWFDRIWEALGLEDDPRFSFRALVDTSGEEALANVMGAIIEFKEVAESIKLPTDIYGPGPAPDVPPVITAALEGFNELKAAVQDTTGEFATLFFDMLGDSENAFRSFAENILRIWQRLASQLIATELFKKIAPFLGFGETVAEIGRSGGIVGSIGSRMSVPTMAFAGAPHFARGGIVGDAVPVIAHRGEMIVPKDQVGRGGLRVDVVQNFNVAALDGPSVAEVLRGQKFAIAQAVVEAVEQAPGIRKMLR